MANETKWSIDQAHSEITFKVRHLMIAHVKGSFKTFDASIYTVEKDFVSTVIDLWIDVSSISTGDEKRDEHLKSADFFDVQNHKQITFVSSTISNAGKGENHEIWGELTIKGITKNVMINAQFNGIVKDPWENEKVGFSITGTIKRSDWGLVWNMPLTDGGIMVSDEISIICEVELINKGKKDLIMELESSVEKNTN
ncbi:MAG: hypothetical protein A2033_04685 [Bacteroidetes bacterium GWA2_31_9]|nr:MAG: hypothetical protein A2033_04685 [Bacteroidetes bacterium GWA2_31_9]